MFLFILLMFFVDIIIDVFVDVIDVFVDFLLSTFLLILLPV